MDGTLLTERGDPTPRENEPDGENSAWTPVLALLRLDAGVLDHLSPLAKLDLDEVLQLLGRA